MEFSSRLGAVAHVPRLFHPGPLGPGPLMIAGDAAKRLTAVMRAAEGDPVLLFTGDGKEWNATAGMRSRDTVQLTVAELGRQAAPPQVVLETWVGVIRTSRFEEALEKIVEAGADLIRPVICEFSQRGEASGARLERWRRIAIEASEQCGRLFVPEVLAPAPLARALDAFRGTIVVAEGSGESSMALAPLMPQAGHLALVVGPEGGLSPTERQTLARRGALQLALGPYILRTETAAIVGTAALRELTFTEHGG